MDEEGEQNPGAPDLMKEQAKARLAAALMAANPLLASFPFDFQEIARLQKISPEQARLRFRHLELNGPENGNGIQIMLFDGSASLTVPYWHHARAADAVWEEIWSYLTILEREGGLSAFDPQLERPLSLDKDRPVVLAKYLEGVAFTDGVAATYTQSPPPPKPWWKFW